MTLKDASRATRLQWFARQVIDAAWGGDVDAVDVQAWAKSAGLLVERAVTDENREWVDANVMCPEALNIGDSFLEFSDDVSTASVRWDEIAAEKATV